MNLSKIILEITGRLKPLLLKMFPYSLLRKLKGRMIQNSFKKLLKIQKEPFQRIAYKDGINLIGNIKADTGLGQSCRLVASELEHCCVPYSVYQYNQLGLMSTENKQFDHKISREFPYNINLIHINPHEFGLAVQQLDRSIWDKRYNIGFWLWELEEFPEEWTPCFHCLDEIWAPSEFISNSIRKKTNLPVVTVPYHVEVEIGKEYERKDFNLPEEVFLFLMMYDRTSMTERKNPAAVLKAYKQAFAKDEAAGLVIKINNCTEEEIQSLKTELKGWSNVYFITDVLDRDQVNCLIQCVDAVISLHRAEGFGLVLAEAMLLGTPVIATNWSSNTEFMTEETSCLVNYRLVELKEDIGLFKKGSQWADADIDQAAVYMRKLFEETEFRAEMAEHATLHIKITLSMEKSVNIINQRVNEIYETENKRIY